MFHGFCFLHYAKIEITYEIKKYINIKLDY